jgi:ABC-type amino acid transport substrate-binding protein
VGYSPNTPPFCFYNVDGTVVGYDIAFAYDLAYALNCKLELIPMNYQRITEELNTGLYDIAMSAVSITEARLKQISFTKAYMTPRLVFVVPEKKQTLFSSLESVMKNDRLSIAVLKGTSFELLAKELFPNHPLILISDRDAFQNSKADAWLWEEQEAIAWTLRHRTYRVLFPSPSMGLDSLGYAVRSQDIRFLSYLNQWLELKKTEGYTQKQYALWIHGKTEIAAPPQTRWSVIRNVLHWVD